MWPCSASVPRRSSKPFLEPNPICVPAMQRVVKHFVAASARGEETPVARHIVPQVCCERVALGLSGLGLPDLAAHSTAMLAKKGLLLFRHSSHPWQDLVRHTAAALFFSRTVAAPGLLPVGDQPGQLLPGSNASLPSAIHDPGNSEVERSSHHGAASVDHQFVLVELTFHNTPDLAAHPAADPELVSPAACAWHCLQHVHVAYLGRAALQASEQSSLARLSEPWRPAVTRASPAYPAWNALTLAGQPPAYLNGPDPMSGAFALWELWPSGLLQRLPLGTPRSAGPPRPALVMPRPKPKSAWLRADYDF